MVIKMTKKSVFQILFTLLIISLFGAVPSSSQADDITLYYNDFSSHSVDGEVNIDDYRSKD